MAAFDDLMGAPTTPAPAAGTFDDLMGAAPATVSTGQRVLRGVLDPIEGGAQLLYNALPSGVVRAGNRLNNALAQYGLVAPISDAGLNADIRAREAAYQASRGADRGTTDWARIGGNIVSPANLALGGALRPATALGASGTGVATGAASGALEPVYSPDSDVMFDKLKNAAVGGAIGGTMGAVGAGLSRVLSPNASRNPNVQALLNEDVRPTIGQALGGTANRWEENLATTPFVGDSIIGARQRARESFDQAAFNRVTGPIGAPPVTTRGHEAVNELQDAVSGAYTSAAQRLGSFQLDRQGVNEMTRLHGMVQNLPADQQRIWQGTLNEIGTDISPQGFIQGEGFKNIDS